MARYSNDTRRRLKKIKPKDVIAALTRDGWTQQPKKSAEQSFIKIIDGEPKLITIHVHNKEYQVVSFLEEILEPTGWNDEDLVKVGLIKRLKSDRR